MIWYRLLEVFHWENEIKSRRKLLERDCGWLRACLGDRKTKAIVAVIWDQIIWKSKWKKYLKQLSQIDILTA